MKKYNVGKVSNFCLLQIFEVYSKNIDYFLEKKTFIIKDDQKPDGKKQVVIANF